MLSVSKAYTHWRGSASVRGKERSPALAFFVFYGVGPGVEEGKVISVLLT
jgi:hypothetical protein